MRKDMRTLCLHLAEAHSQRAAIDQHGLGINSTRPQTRGWMAKDCTELPVWWLGQRQLTQPRNALSVPRSVELHLTDDASKLIHLLAQHGILRSRC
jgi:hypothetical protein